MTLEMFIVIVCLCVITQTILSIMDRRERNKLHDNYIHMMKLAEKGEPFLTKQKLNNEDACRLMKQHGFEVVRLSRMNQTWLVTYLVDADFVK